MTDASNPRRQHRRWIWVLIVGAMVFTAGAFLLVTGRGPELTRPSSDHLVSGRWARVSNGQVASLLAMPSLSSPTVAQVGDGERVAILAELVNSEGTWLSVQTGDQDVPTFGWVRQSDPVSPLRPADDIPCPNSPNVLSIVYLAPAERLACFGSRALAIDVGVFEHAQRTETHSGTPAWLAVPSDLRLWGELGIGSPGGPLSVSIPPGLLPVEDDVWRSVTGHFDDSSADRCEVFLGDRSLSEQEATTWCREQFVVTSVAPAQAPKPSREVVPVAPGDPG